MDVVVIVVRTNLPYTRHCAKLRVSTVTTLGTSIRFYR